MPKPETFCGKTVIGATVIDPRGGLNATICCRCFIPKQLHLAIEAGYYSPAYRPHQPDTRDMPVRVIIDPGHKSLAKMRPTTRRRHDR
jgi:hypothetical protein